MPKKPFNYKLLAFCFLFLFIFNNNKAQENKEIAISGNYQNVSVVSFLDELEKKYSITFYYNPEWFIHDSVNLFFNNTPLSQALQRAIKGKSVVHLQDKNFVFLPNEEIALLNGQAFSNEAEESGTRIIGNPMEEGKYSKVIVKGLVSDGKNGEPLIGATLQIENTNTACVTDVHGKFSLTTSPGLYKLIVSNIGYEKTTQKVKIISNGEINFELFDVVISINEVSVKAKKADRNVSSSQMSIVELDAKSIKQLPSITGEKDILKSFTMMPGVKSVGEFGSGINIRGGGTDQNLILIEGTPIFNTSHVFGLISVVNPDMANNVTLYKGHIPSTYGERVSSVMDIQLKDNNPEVWGVNGGIGIYNSRLMCELPLYKKNLSIKFGGRANYSDWILRQLKDKDLSNSKVNFYDFNSIAAWNFGKNRIVAVAYISNDDFKYVNFFNYNYKNNLGSLCWNHFASRDLTTTLQYSFSQYQITKDNLSESNDQSRIFSGINYNSLKFNTQYTPNSKHSIDAGINGIYYLISPGKQDPLDSSSVIKPITLQEEKAFEGTIYLNDKWDINETFSINAGLRFTAYTKLGPGTTYIYPTDRSKMSEVYSDTLKYANNNVMQFYNGIEPRLAFKIQFDKFSSVKLSYNNNKQYISLISNTAVPNPNDFWKMSDRYIKPLDCSHYAIGFYRNFSQNKYETSVELYYKTLKNLLEYKNGAMLSLNPVIETALMNTEGKNYGVEFFVKKNYGDIDGWLSYTYSRSLKKTNSSFPEEIINNNQYYPSTFDKPHEITLLLMWHINRRVRVSGNFDYSSGRAITIPESKYYIEGLPVVQFAGRNTYRLPDYHRLDLSFSVDENLKLRKQYKGSWTLSVINVYGQKNIYSVYLVNQKPSVRNNNKNTALYKLIIIGMPLVSITYNFMF
jgi:hypothetical protein